MARRLEDWISELARTVAIIAADGEVCREAARLMVAKSEDLFEDALIAATARVRHLTVVTRNVRDFVPFRVPTLNPFTSSH